MYAHYYIYSYGILRFPSDNTASITPNENTTLITVNDVTMQKVSLLKRSLHVSFISNLLSIYFCASISNTNLRVEEPIKCPSNI